MVDAALKLARRIVSGYPYPLLDPLTHLKLQKLCFYGYGVCAALGGTFEIGSIRFEAWKHGPVNRSVWDAYKSFGRDPIAQEGTAPSYSLPVEAVLRDVVTVYGALDAWSLRQQSHLEAPWRDASEGALIDDTSIRTHFAKKLTPGAVQCPEYLADVGSLKLDGIPVASFESLQELARSVRRSLSVLTPA